MQATATTNPFMPLHYNVMEKKNCMDTRNVHQLCHTQTLARTYRRTYLNPPTYTFLPHHLSHPLSQMITKKGVSVITDMKKSETWTTLGPGTYYLLSHTHIVTPYRTLFVTQYTRMVVGVLQSVTIPPFYTLIALDDIQANISKRMDLQNCRWCSKLVARYRCFQNQSRRL